MAQFSGYLIQIESEEITQFSLKIFCVRSSLRWTYGAKNAGSVFIPESRGRPQNLDLGKDVRELFFKGFEQGRITEKS